MLFLGAKIARSEIHCIQLGSCPLSMAFICGKIRCMNKLHYGCVLRLFLRRSELLSVLSVRRLEEARIRSEASPASVCSGVALARGAAFRIRSEASRASVCSRWRYSSCAAFCIRFEVCRGSICSGVAVAIQQSLSVRTRT